MKFAPEESLQVQQAGVPTEYPKTQLYFGLKAMMIIPTMVNMGLTLPPYRKI